MNDNLTVAPQVLRDSATEMQVKVETIKSVLNSATMEINKVSDNYQGSASDSFYAKYNTMKTKFDNFCQEIDEYIKFLNKTADTYEEQDSAIAQKAEDILS